MDIFNNLLYKNNFTICIGPDDPNIKEAILHPNTEIIRIEAFKDSQIETVKFNNSLDLIEEEAFMNSNIKKIDLSNTNARLSSKMCAECINLKEIILNDAGILPISAFEHCKNLEKVDLSKYSIGLMDLFCFANCSNLKEIILPNSLNHLGTQAFCNCINLKNITLPNNLKAIGTRAFECTSIKSLTLPDSLERFDDFLYGSKIKELFYNNLNPEIEKKIENLAENYNVSIYKLSLNDLIISKSFRETNKIFLEENIR